MSFAVSRRLRYSGRIFSWLAGLTASAALASALALREPPPLDLRGLCLESTSLVHARLDGANLSGARLHGSDLASCSLQRVSLQGADLSCTMLSGTDLRGADLSGADLRGANLDEAKLQGARLQDVLYDADTSWPDGFLPPEPVPPAQPTTYDGSPA